ncbi:HTH domain containing transcriptional regulator [Bacillus phage Kirov]|uniref:HTH domain containing transcriptional regulator n=1 Tax=Bacillus phage Kirov TaxID=2783539 RepID=A0A7S6U2W8_9CAUD|nr:sigma factor [Bacillus phage Kirov]QOV08223.1 HTH domain containing transcriptional regulator [Bacillus phage Kirov]
MGSVAIDTKKKEREFEHLTLSDENVVKYLILYRSKVDTTYGANTNIEINSAGDTFDFNQEIITLYASLDRVIEQASLTKNQIKILDLLYEGNTVNDVCKILGRDRSVIKRTFDRIIEKVVTTDNEMWYYTMGKNGLIITE